jgi:DNA-binding transcriptional regulator YiaG
MSTEPPATGGRRRHAARNAAIADAVMHGASLREVGKAHGLIFSRVHKIVADECRRRNPALYDALTQAGRADLETLRERAAAFGVTTPAPHPVNEFGHIRRQLRLSQRQYAKALGLSTLTIWHYERGSRRIPHPVMVAARSLHAPTQTSPSAG